MIGLTSLFDIARSALTTSQQALAVTGHNVANVNTPDYARKIHDQQNRLLGGIGAGVETAQIVRRIDQFLRRDLMQETTVLGSAQVRSDYLNRMQAMFGSLGNNNALGNSLTDLSSAIENVANSPEVAAHRFDAVNEAMEMAQYFNDMGSQVQQLRTQADAEIADAVDVINMSLGGPFPSRVLSSAVKYSAGPTRCAVSGAPEVGADWR